jgi:DNA-binding transcriptional regulator GbsR (MarR family)
MLEQNNSIFKFLAAAQALKDPYRQQIFVTLISRNNLSFNDLVHELNISRQKLAYHLQILIKYNIIINFYDKREGIKDHSFYELSSFGKDLLLGSPTKIQENEIELTTPQKKQTSKSNNFRTIHHVEYKSYKNEKMKISKSSITPFEPDQKVIFDPWLGCDIQTIIKKVKKTNKVELPTYRQYYLLHKHPFKQRVEINPKYWTKKV